MRKLSLLLLTFCFLFSLRAQVSHKLGLSLYSKLQKPAYAQSAKLKAVLVKGDPGVIKGLVSQYGGVYKFAAGDISSVSIPYKNLIAFSREAGIVRLEASEATGHTFMDSARIFNNIDSAHQGIAPLTQPYNGSGVLVGIIDGGIYFRHQDFRRANGNTRILYLWDQYLSSAPSPAPFGYGAEWDSAGINAGQCNSSDPASDQGHGTNVAGIAAGNGLSWPTGPLAGRYTGTAPNSDMIVVNLNDTSSDFLQTVVDAVNYIFTKAAALGRPCVINTSVGTYYGSHDGQDLSSLAINAMIEAQKGRVVVAAAGNAGGLKYHLSYPLSQTDSLFTWFADNTTYHEAYFDFWVDTAGANLIHFALGGDSSTGAFLARTNYLTIDSFPGLAQGVTVQISDSLYEGIHNLGDYNIAVTLSGGTYHVEFLVYPTLTTYLWRLQTMGQGQFDLWSSAAAIGGSSNILDILPGTFTSPEYRYPDSLKTLVSSWQCSDDVITVGNFSNRLAYQDSAGAYIASGVPDGSLISNSSIGPTRDGRIKPDITATGSVTTSTGDSMYIALLSLSPANAMKISLGGKHTRNGGTSMASPVVTGTAALYLEEHPNAGFSEVKQVLEATAKKDAYTGTVPNVDWGWGKVNCYQALLYPVVYGCMDTGSINYNPSANIDTGGCIPKVYGCTDTASINYDSTANVNNGTCIAKVYGIMDTACLNYNANANVSGGVCVAKVYGIMDTGCINYNPNANVSDGACVAKVYGITDSLCSNYNPNANVSSGVCIPLAVKDVNNNISFDIIPNPMTNTALIEINSTMPLVNASVRFYDVLGNLVDAVTIPAGMTQVTYTNTKLASGLYDAAIVSDGHIVATKKIVAE